MGAADRSSMTAVPSWMVCCGFFALVQHGQIYRMSILHTPPAFRRFSDWVKDGTLARLLEALAQDLEARGDIYQNNNRILYYIL
jgi:hypothetical protein